MPKIASESQRSLESDRNFTGAGAEKSRTASEAV